jgi:hypothetical protein
MKKRSIPKIFVFSVFWLGSFLLDGWVAILPANFVFIPAAFHGHIYTHTAGD